MAGRGHTAQIKGLSYNNVFGALLEPLNEGDNLDGLTDSESMEDGKAVLEERRKIDALGEEALIPLRDLLPFFEREKAIAI